MPAVLSELEGGHKYEDEGTSDCQFGCECWMGPSRSGGPDGLDPFGKCPKNPKNASEGVETPTKPLTLEELVGADLSGFTVQPHTEVFRTDEDGMKVRTLGYFKDEVLALGFAGMQSDRNSVSTRSPVFLLTGGKLAFTLGEPALIVDETDATLKLKAAALAKLNVAERRVLGFE